MPILNTARLNFFVFGKISNRFLNPLLHISVLSMNFMLNLNPTRLNLFSSFKRCLLILTISHLILHQLHCKSQRGIDEENSCSKNIVGLYRRQESCLLNVYCIVKTLYTSSLLLLSATSIFRHQQPTSMLPNTFSFSERTFSFAFC